MQILITFWLNLKTVFPVLCKTMRQLHTRTKTLFMLNFSLTFRLLVMIVKVHLIFRNNRIFLIMVKFMMSIRLNAENTENICAVS